MCPEQDEGASGGQVLPGVFPPGWKAVGLYRQKAPCLPQPGQAQHRRYSEQKATGAFEAAAMPTIWGLQIMAHFPIPVLNLLAPLAQESKQGWALSPAVSPVQDFLGS